MKTVKKTSPLKLLPFSLLIAPVAEEMALNKEGLPTPWPIDLISILISMVSVLVFEGKKRRKKFSLVVKNNWLTFNCSKTEKHL